MPDAEHGRAFPAEDSLCERCGYPIRGLPLESDCPECGLSVVGSSPALRSGDFETRWYPLGTFVFSALEVLLSPTRTFRGMSIDGSNRFARTVLLASAFLASLLWYFTGYKALGMFRWSGWVAFIVVYSAIMALTYIEMLGVTGISRRRGWRVPFHLAERVCCYASVGWLPGVLIAGGGAWLLTRFADGEPWFDQLLGLVRVRWLFYGLLFIISFLWFETLVWLGVRQVKYANAWPKPAPGISHHAHP